MTLLFRSLLLTTVIFPLSLTTLLASAEDDFSSSKTSKKPFTSRKAKTPISRSSPRATVKHFPSSKSVSPSQKPASSRTASSSSGATPDLPVKPKSISMVSHTFSDVISFPPATYGPPRKLTISLPYEYRPIDPSSTRLFFQGEALIIDPETSPFETYVTYPLRPCIFGQIYDPVTKRSLIFHKYAVHDMKSLDSYFKQFSPSNPEALQVKLFTCELSAALTVTHAPYFGGKTLDGKIQIHEMNAVRDFLKRNLSIPEDNIERRFLTDSMYKGLPHLGQYELTPVTVGVSKTGDVFNTSIFNIDLFGVGAKPLPRMKKRKAQVVNNLPATEKPPIMQSVCNVILEAVKQHYDTDPLHNTYWTRPFFSADIMNVPAASLGDMFCVEFREKELVAKKISELGILPSSPEDTTPSPVPPEDTTPSAVPPDAPPTSSF
jgi:hypothetical protein